MVRLLCELLHGAPSLPGAACRGKWEMFDPLAGTSLREQRAERERRVAAARVCGTCPARLACPTVTTSMSAGVAVGARHSNAVRRLTPPPSAA